MKTVILGLILLALIPPPLTALELKQAELQVEIGSDNRERRFYRPRFIFAFPLGQIQFKADFSYYQQANSRTAGMVDYWVKLSLEKKLTDAWSGFFGFSHFCRHQLLIDTPYVFNINEITAGMKLSRPNSSFSLAGGTLVHGTYENKLLLLGRAEIGRFLLPELRGSVEFRYVGSLPLMYSFETGLELSDGLEIFARLEKRYRLAMEAFLGFRISSGGQALPLVDRIGLANALVLGHSEHKFESAGEFRLNFPARNNARIYASAHIYSPFHNGDSFLGTFFPAELRYLLELRYQRPLAGMQAGWFWEYDINGPFDRDAALASEMSIGFFLAGQDDFKKLEKAIRFEIKTGLGFKNGLLAGARLGLNTAPGKAAIVGLEGELLWRPDHLYWQLRLFSSGPDYISLRPYLALSGPARYKAEQKRETRLALGLEWLAFE